MQYCKTIRFRWRDFRGILGRHRAQPAKGQKKSLDGTREIIITSSIERSRIDLIRRFGGGGKSREY